MTTKRPATHARPRRTAEDDLPKVPETSFAERVRTLLEAQRVGTLSTHSTKAPGYPFGSVMPYALDGEGNPLFLISALAMHTQNLRQDAKASLLVAQDSVGKDPLGAARVTLVGDGEKVDQESELAEVRERYLDWHANAAYWVDFKDFAFYRLRVAEIYYVGGFGVMGWVESGEFAEAAPDPLAPAAAGILEHMNADHADALVLLARHQGGLPETEEAKMTSVDRLGFRLRARTVNPEGDHWHSRRLAFGSSIETPTAARQELVAMVKAARAAISS